MMIPLQETHDIKNFVWKAMNFAYLYKDDSPNLANDRFATESDYQSFLNNYESPENLFESLILTEKPSIVSVGLQMTI